MQLGDIPKNIESGVFIASFPFEVCISIFDGTVNCGNAAFNDKSSPGNNNGRRNKNVHHSKSVNQFCSDMRHTHRLRRATRSHLAGIAKTFSPEALSKGTLTSESVA